MNGNRNEQFQEYKTNSNECINFKLIRSESDFDKNDIVFHPDMTHQIFGDTETIFGYKDLKVDIFYTASYLRTHIKMKYSEKLDPESSEGIEPDNVLKILSKEYKNGLIETFSDFKLILKDDIKFIPFGKKVHSYSKEQNGNMHQFSIFKCDIDDNGFRSFHERMQSFLLFFVDAACYIDVDDNKWDYYILFEEYKTSEGNIKFAFIGYMTIYNYYAYPEHIRPRISQVLILPPFQRMGHGVEIVQTFYKECFINKMIKDITVEDPSENFQRIRDYIDAKNCQSLSSFKSKIIKNGYTENMFKEANEKYKLCRRQARRVYEILRLQCTNKNDAEEYKEYRLDVKKRLNAPFHKSKRDFEKLKRLFGNSELSETLCSAKADQDNENLSKLYEELELEYFKIIDRLTIGE